MEFLHWAITGNVDLFYEMFRWNGWTEEIKKTVYDQGVLCYPPLWSGNEPVSNRSRTNVSIEELWDSTVGSNTDNQLIRQTNNHSGEDIYAKN